MDYKYINQLLERYWNCETSLEEEKILRAFFSQADIPADLERYRSLFIYEQEEQHTVLGSDFDERMMSLIDEPVTVKARTVTLTQRLMPLFKAAAMVAIILTLGNAMQKPFQKGYPEAVDTPAAKPGMSVALGGDSTKVDTLQQSNLQQLPTTIAPITDDLQPTPTSLEEE
jgi:hypothetical protein